MAGQNPGPALDLSRGQWWRLASGTTVEICRVYFSPADDAFVVTVRRLDENNAMAHGSFNVRASLITSTAKKVQR